MSMINTTSFATTAPSLGSTPEALGRSLGRLSANAKLIRSSAGTAAPAQPETLVAESRRIQVAETSVQNALSHVQSADGVMARLAHALSRMGELSGAPRGSGTHVADGAAEDEFIALQHQLHEEIGALADQPGGAEGGRALLGICRRPSTVGR